MQNREEIVHFLKDLRETIINAFEKLEEGAGFQRTCWEHKTGGGGEMAVLRGSVFEKAAVNWSGVCGDNFPMQDGAGPFFATGVSLITHMANPHAPTAHFNIRYIETKERSWIAGGYDLTPMGLPYAEDTEYFHSVAKKTCGEHYPLFYKQAQEYFYIPHRKKERGVGGIFFDHWDVKNLSLWKQIGSSFLSALIPIYTKRIHMPFTSEEKTLQLKHRAHYVEFNLLYDRGTKFGFLSGGNPEAILCSMPPLASW